MVGDYGSECKRYRGWRVHAINNGLSMDTKDVKTVAMFGPSISEPSKIVNRDVPVCDVQAYKAAGYQLGSKPVEVEVFKSADTGQFVSEEAAKASPKTTYKTKRK